MTIEFVCDYCEFQGSRDDYYKHIETSEKCDDRDPCCKLESMADYNKLNSWEICDDCDQKISDYYEDLYTDALMESYYEGQ